MVEATSFPMCTEMKKPIWVVQVFTDNNMICDIISGKKGSKYLKLTTYWQLDFTEILGNIGQKFGKKISVG